MLKAIVVLIALFVSTAIHAQPTSAWSQRNAYQPPKSAWKDSLSTAKEPVEQSEGLPIAEERVERFAAAS